MSLSRLDVQSLVLDHRPRQAITPEGPAQRDSNRYLPGKHPRPSGGPARPAGVALSRHGGVAAARRLAVAAARSAAARSPARTLVREP